ncbi:uncharacterized protein LOC112541701 [Python bivittatus]|uniref:Uncharacterized protein LOC112541701 n=1 Tax=Python bivittatus TaxID=176946 RepID=A0A9F5IY09_PYTBI|nr:uncharacterized protein LOC112541701 [Python bivittatus]
MQKVPSCLSFGVLPFYATFVLLPPQKQLLGLLGKIWHSGGNYRAWALWSLLLICIHQAQAEMPHTPRQRLQPRAPVWSETETRDFLALWGELLILRWIENRPPNSDIYEDLSAQMIARGHERNASQCRNRARDLKRSYRRAKDAQICAGAEPVSCRYFRELDQMFGGEMDRATNRSLAGMDGSMRVVVKSEDAKDMEAQVSEEEGNQMTPPNTLSSMDADTDTETEPNMGISRELVTVVDPSVIETTIVEEGTEDKAVPLCGQRVPGCSEDGHPAAIGRGRRDNPLGRPLTTAERMASMRERKRRSHEEMMHEIMTDYRRTWETMEALHERSEISAGEFREAMLREMLLDREARTREAQLDRESRAREAQLDREARARDSHLEREIRIKELSMIEAELQRTRDILHPMVDAVASVAEALRTAGRILPQSQPTQQARGGPFLESKESK